MSIHSNVEPESAELLFRTLHAANQLSIHGAVAHWCNRQQVQVTELSTEPHLFHGIGNTSARCKSAQSRSLLEAARLATMCEDAGFVRAVSKGQSFMTGPELDEVDNSIQVYVENTRILEIILLPTPKDQLESKQDSAQPWKLLPPRCAACVEPRLKFFITC